MGWTTRITVVAAVAVVAAGIAWGLRPQPVRVDAVAVTRGAFVEEVTSEGRTHMRVRHEVDAPIAGLQSRIRFEVGDPVDRETVVATIGAGPTPIDDPRTRRQLEERLGAAEAARSRADVVVARAASRHEQADADLARSADLVEKGSAPTTRREQDALAATIAERDLDVARLEVVMAAHEVDLARAAVGLSLPASEHPGGERLDIRSPIEGVVLRVMRESAGPVAIGTPILEIADPDRLEIEADVLTTDAVRIRPGAPVIVERWGGPRPLAAVVRRVEPAGFTKVSALGVDEQRVRVVMDLTSPRDEWRRLGDAFRVEVRVEISRDDDALMVPVAALVRDGAGWSLFVVEAGRAVRRPAERIASSGRVARVRADLRPGDRVIAFPPATLGDGARVEIVGE